MGVILTYLIFNKDYSSTQSKSVVEASTPSIESSSQPSPDGLWKVLMTTTPLASGSAQYIFSTVDKSNIQQEIYSHITNEKYMIPFNAWSPDDKYVFIQKDTGEAYVFTRSGDPITSLESFLDVKAIFNQTERKDIYDHVTGWASPSLLIINTMTDNGEKGSSYWFEVPSKAIIQLWGDF